MRLLRILTLACALAAAAAAAGAVAPPAVYAQNQTPARPEPVEEFVPIDQLPPQEQVPAARLVVVAYSFVWVAFLAYVITLVRRMRKVEADLASLERNRR